MIEDYLSLVTIQHQKPKFMAVVAEKVKHYVLAQEAMSRLIEDFDLDTAEGDQLDIIGQWVGVQRAIAVNINDIDFGWNIAPQGWNFSEWKGINDSEEDLKILPDEGYRSLIKFKIAQNHWDGTVGGLYSLLYIIFPQYHFSINDKQDMTMDLICIGNFTSLERVIIIGNYLGLKNSGVRIVYEIQEPADQPIFSWDLDEQEFKGWDISTWIEESRKLGTKK